MFLGILLGPQILIKATFCLKQNLSQKFKSL